MYKYFVKPLLMAFSLLTRIPVKTGAASDEDWGRSAGYFPFCGYVLAVLAALPFMLLSYFSDNAVAIIVIGDFFFIVVLAWMTGMLHIDGFCDACDAFASMSGTKEDRLRIMKDPHPGAAAVAYLVLLIVGKLLMVFFLIFIAEKFMSEFFVGHFKGTMQSITMLKICLALGVLVFLSATTVLARFAMVVLAAVSRYPREKGTGAVIIGKVPVSAVLIALIWIIPLVLLIPFKNLAIAVLFAGIVTAYWKFKADRLLGGVTGDILGACCESVEVAVAFGLVLPEFF